MLLRTLYTRTYYCTFLKNCRAFIYDKLLKRSALYFSVFTLHYVVIEAIYSPGLQDCEGGVKFSATVKQFPLPQPFSSYYCPVEIFLLFLEKFYTWYDWNLGVLLKTN